jgi:hypothetical protein
MKKNRKTVYKAAAIFTAFIIAGLYINLRSNMNSAGNSAENIKVHHTESSVSGKDESANKAIRVLQELFKGAVFEKEIDPVLIDANNDPNYKDLVDRIDELNIQHASQPDDQKSQKKLILEESSLAIDHTLGNFPRKKEFLDTVAWSYDVRQPINDRFNSGSISRTELFNQLDSHLKVLGDKYASIFTDDEYYKMFQMKKGESLSQVLGITPEVAEALDKRDQQAKYDDLPRGAYDSDGTLSESFKSMVRAIYSDK